MRRTPAYGAGLTIGFDRHIIGIKTKEGRGSAHYELIWEIPIYITYAIGTCWIIYGQNDDCEYYEAYV